MSDALPAYYDDLAGSLSRSWALIEEGAADRHSPCHTPTIASRDRSGAPSMRVMVMREAQRADRRLRFHTDSRADKVDELQEDARTGILLYDADAKIQLRLHGHSEIETHSAAADKAWDKADNYARRCYLAEPAPGTMVPQPTSGLRAELEGVKPTDEQLAPARPNFSILRVTIERIEYLYLAHQGHRRARFDWTGDRWEGQWLVP